MLTVSYLLEKAATNSPLKWQTVASFDKKKKEEY